MNTRTHELQISLPASANEVWEAVSTPSEIVKWFTSGARIEPGPGGTPSQGKLWLAWGDSPEGAHHILVWEPGKRLVLGYGGQTVEFSIEAAGGTTTLHLVHSGFSADAKFDDEYEATFGGWSTYLAVLNYVLKNKRGQDVVNVTVTSTVERPRHEVKLLMADGSQVLGMPVNLVSSPKDGYLVVSVPALDDSPVALFCEALAGKSCVTVSAYLFGDGRNHAETIRQRAGALFAEIK